MKRIVTKLVGIMLLSLITTSVSAQGGYQVKGVVTDAMGPVVGATVMEQGTTNGTTTGLDGDYVLKVASPDAVVEISSIGYTKVSFKASEVPALVTLAEDAEFLDEVVVIGYGTVKKTDLTGSVSTVRADEINKGVITTPADLLRGKSAGVVVTSGSGMPGAGATIRIRGGSSISANDPLVVIDGLPVANDGISGMADPLSSINPEDIESFTVLKDASATAIYGSRASNGVIVITSKKGKMEQRPQVKISAQYSFANIINSGIQMMGSQDYMAFREMLDPSLATNGEWLTHKNVVSKNGISTDWMKEIYRDNAPSLQLNASVMGGSTNTNYYLSVNHTARNGIEPLSGFQRESLRFNEDIRIAPMLKVGVDANLSYNKSETNPEQNSGDLYLTNPTVFSRLARPDDAPYYYTVNPDYSINRFGRADYLHYTGTNSYNPWWMAEHRKRESRTVHLDGNIFEEVTPISGLRLKAVQALAAYDDNYTSISKPRDYYNSEMGDRVDAYGDGSSAYRTESSQRWYQFTSSNTAEYSFNLDSKHNFTFLLGQETIYSKDQGFAVSRSGLTDIRMLLLTNATEEPATTQDFSETVYNSFFV